MFYKEYYCNVCKKYMRYNSKYNHHYTKKHISRLYRI